MQAMLWAEELYLQHVCFELDAQNVVAAAKGDYQQVRWELQSLVISRLVEVGFSIHQTL